MARLDESLTAAREVVLVDPGVVHDIATALSGVWHPDREADPDLARHLVAAARLRLYGADADRSGWHLVTTAAAALHADALGAEDLASATPDPPTVPSIHADWSAGFLPALESFDDAPPAADVADLAALLRRESGLDDDDARTLALALLCEQVGLVVTRHPDAFAHRRPADLPERLEVVDPATAVARLDLAPGEAAWSGPPEGTALASVDPWWVPGGAGDEVRTPAGSR
jgi:hypothetical protein